MYQIISYSDISYCLKLYCYIDTYNIYCIKLKWYHIVLYHITSYHLTCVHIQPCCFKNIVPHFKPDGISHSSTETVKLAPPLTRYLCPYVIREHKSAQPVWILVDAGPPTNEFGESENGLSPPAVMRQNWSPTCLMWKFQCVSLNIHFDLGSSIIKGRTFWASTTSWNMWQPHTKIKTICSYESFDPSL